ncbi:MAG: hypothetical protein ABIP74_01330 [Candidatus Saccharimonas sp.]
METVLTITAVLGAVALVFGGLLSLREGSDKVSLVGLIVAVIGLCVFITSVSLDPITLRPIIHSRTIVGIVTVDTTSTPIELVIEHSRYVCEDGVTLSCANLHDGDIVLGMVGGFGIPPTLTLERLLH